MTHYTLVYRTPDNSDGIYRDGRLVVSLRRLEEYGYPLSYLLGCNQRRLAVIAQVVLSGMKEV